MHTHCAHPIDSEMFIIAARTCTVYTVLHTHGYTIQVECTQHPGIVSFIAQCYQQRSISTFILAHTRHSDG